MQDDGIVGFYDWRPWTQDRIGAEWSAWTPGLMCRTELIQHNRKSLNRVYGEGQQY